MSIPTEPTMVVVIEGGLVQEIITNIEDALTVHVLDWDDIEDAEREDARVPFPIHRTFANLSPAAVEALGWGGEEEGRRGGARPLPRPFPPR